MRGVGEWAFDSETITIAKKLLKKRIVVQKFVGFIEHLIVDGFIGKYIGFHRLVFFELQN